MLEFAFFFLCFFDQLRPLFTYSLPTEAQQEYFFRGGTETAYVSGVDETHLGDFAFYITDNSVSPSGERQTHPVRSKKANPFGIHRSSVREWGRDWYAANYPEGLIVDPQGPEAGSERVLRGGSWGTRRQFRRSAHRDSDDPDSRFHNTGFRLSRMLRSS